MANILTGLYSAIPSPQANTGSYYYATDTGIYWQADGDKWIQSTPDVDNSSTPISPDGGLNVHIANTGLSTQSANTSVTFSNSTTSGTIGTATTLLAANTATKSLSIQNTSASATIYVGTATTPTTANSINIGPGVGYQFPVVPTNALNVVGSAASVPYVIWYA